MNPITKYLKNLFSSKRIIGNDSKLVGLAKADALLQKLVDDKKVPGISVTALQGGEILLQKGYGFADIKEETSIDPRKTVFRIASVSKNIAATALAYMVNDGIIDLEASFYTYVPYFPKKRWDFTIRQLAGHTAGIRGYHGAEYGLNKPYSIKESIEIFKDDDLLFEPGTDYHYNSFDWVMISLAMQEVSGIPFEEYVADRVLNPLRMGNTFAEGGSEYNTRAKDPKAKTLTTSDQTNRATFYSKNRLGFRKAIPVNNYYKLAGGGYISTSEDIARFGQAYLDGRVLTEEIVTPFLTSETINKNRTYYGLGWQVSEDKEGRPYYGHIGSGVGGYSNFFVYPNHEMVIALLINCTTPNIQDELDKIINDFTGITG